MRTVNTDLRKIIFRKVAGTSEDWPHFYSRLISSSTSNKLFGYRCGDMKVLPILLEFLTFLSRKWLPLNVPYLPKHRQSQACYKDIVNTNDSKHTAPSWPETLTVLVGPATHPIAFLVFFRYAYYVLCKEWAPIAALTYWVLSFLPDVFECFILKGEKIAWSQWKGFWNYRR